MRKGAKLGFELLVALLCLLCLRAVNCRHPIGPSRNHFAHGRGLYPAGMPFVIADLDGDRKPDLALVEMGSQRSANTNYSIRLQLSAGIEPAISINAPLGGLSVAARDVNGDDNLDLILTSNLDSRFVQVLLNDGHGNFSAAAPGAYPELENETDVFLNGPVTPVMDQTTLASLRSSIGNEVVLACDYHSVLASHFVSLTESLAVPRPIAYARLGRSPPAFVSLS